MKTYATQNANIEKTSHGYLLRIHKGDSRHYRDAQLADYSGLSRRKFPHHSSTISLRARASSDSIPGTWGFGLWNDPFGLSLGFGGSPFRLPALPNAIWFFHASKENYLSFRSTQGNPANGFLVQVFRSPRFHPLLFAAGLTFPFSRKVTRTLLGHIVEEDGSVLSVDVTQWHAYSFEWSPKRTVFWVDDIQVFESQVSPRGPLGLVIWVDNQYAAFTPEGKIGFGVLENPEPAWLEIENIETK